MINLINLEMISIANDYTSAMLDYALRNGFCALRPVDYV